MNNWYLLAAIPVFGLLVLVHEFGHFITAKWAGIRVEEFGLGFPPNIVGFRKRDAGGWEVIWFGRHRDPEISGKQNPFSGTSGGVSNPDAAVSDHTLYTLNLLPIGGFVRMPGENGDVLDDDGNYDPQSFAAKPAGKRIIVLCAGVVMNLLLAMVLFTIAYGLGEPTYTNTATLGTVVANSPAEAAGLRTDDTIISVDGQSTPQFSDMATAVTKITDAAKKQGLNTVPVHLLVKRPGAAAPITITVNALVSPPAGQGHLGVEQKITFVSTPLWLAPFKGIQHTFEVTRDFLGQIALMIRGAVKPELAGPVGIVKITGQVAQTVPDLGWWPILSLTSILSLNLAIVNILPFPALDGGRIVLVLLELIRGGKRLRPEREGIINLVGMAILLALMVIITISDVARWGS
jgi:regulator of sigma E protease